MSDNKKLTENFEQMEQIMFRLKLKALELEQKYIEEQRKCIQCGVNERNITFLPCGHFIMCKPCQVPLYECPTCDKDILATADTFL